jgi:lycopene cyclase CruP
MMHSQLPPNLEDFDQFWQKYREGSLAPVQVIHDRAPENGKNPDYDLVICGGTLGIFLGCAMQCKGWRVAIVEKNILAGREQEWNISRSELNALIEVATLTEQELERTIVTDYNPARIGFYGGQEVWVRDILNIGVSPKLLIEQIKYNFLKAGGMVLEQAKFHAATVYQNGVEVTIQPKSSEIVTLTGKVLIDAMGHFSPIVQQCYQNQADSICMVVGGCATGLPATSYGDLIYSFTPALRDKNNFLRQYFWEAFPAGDGRTVYSFVYLDRHNWQLSFDELWHTFYSLLPQYQSTDCNEISFKRQLMGFFPAYRNLSLIHI